MSEAIPIRRRPDKFRLDPSTRSVAKTCRVFGCCVDGGVAASRPGAVTHGVGTQFHPVESRGALATASLVVALCPICDSLSPAKLLGAVEARKRRPVVIDNESRPLTTVQAGLITLEPGGHWLEPDID